MHQLPTKCISFLCIPLESTSYAPKMYVIWSLAQRSPQKILYASPHLHFHTSFNNIIIIYIREINKKIMDYRHWKFRGMCVYIATWILDIPVYIYVHRARQGIMIARRHIEATIHYRYAQTCSILLARWICFFLPRIGMRVRCRFIVAGCVI